MSHPSAHPIAGIAVASVFLLMALLTVCRQFAMRDRSRSGDEEQSR